jgi:hypothetical protein
LAELLRRSAAAGDLPVVGGQRAQVTVTVPLDTLRRLFPTTASPGTAAGTARDTGLGSRTGTGTATGTVIATATATATGTVIDVDTASALGHVSRALLQRLAGVPGQARFADGTVVSIELARRIACDAEIIPAVLGSRSEVLDLGRAVRLATPAQRRALALHYRGCAFPGCTRPPGWTIAHHWKHWADGGSSDLANYLPLCERHHTVVHHGDWEIIRADDGEFDFVPPPRVDRFRRPRRQPHLRR